MFFPCLDRLIFGAPALAGCLVAQGCPGRQQKVNYSACWRGAHLHLRRGRKEKKRIRRSRPAFSGPCGIGRHDGTAIARCARLFHRAFDE
jgi:hypothetical protein